MVSNRIVYLNGNYVAWNQATVHIMCHSFGRGSAVFEVLGLHNTDDGTVIFRLDEHIDRLFRTTELLDMELPLSKKDFMAVVTNTVQKNTIRQGFIKIIGYYPQISFEILPPQKMIDIAVFIIDPAEDPVAHDDSFERGTTACISSWIKLDPRTVPIEAKVAANYLNGMMARKEAEKRGFDYAIMLDTWGFIAEGGTESVFLVNNGKLLTPMAGTVLDSITRKSILQVAAAEGIPTREDHLLPELLYEVDEIFFSGTPNKVLPVRQIEEQPVAGTPGPLTRRLSDVMKDIVSGRDSRFRDWLFPVLL
ncbi:MAG: branched-chain-amino-acid transaminase [Deltaproteobacteria bacterium]|nr:branched-chain-amino-acid transaminase [Deltaproteobacteria bacterium]